MLELKRIIINKGWYYDDFESSCIAKQIIDKNSFAFINFENYTLNIKS